MKFEGEPVKIGGSSKRFLSALLCLLFTLQYSSLASVASATANTGNTGLNLTVTPNGSISFNIDSRLPAQLTADDLYFSSDCVLLKVDNNYVRGRSIDELNVMLSGPANSKVSITYLEGDVVKTKLLVRYTLDKFVNNNQNLGKFFEKGRALETLLNGSYTVGAFQLREAKSLDEQGYDFLAAPYFVVATGASKFRFGSFYDDYVTAVPEALDFFAQTGMLKLFNKTKEKAVNIASSLPNGCRASDAIALAKASCVLADIGDTTDARAIDEKLYKISSHLPPQSRMRVLRSYAFLLEQFKNFKAAQTINDELLEACLHFSTEPDDFLLEMLKSVVSYSVRSSSAEIGIKAQSEVVRLTNKASAYKLKHAGEVTESLCALLELVPVER